MKFIFMTEFGEVCDVAMACKNAGHEVLVCITSDEYKKINDGMLDKEQNWYRYLGKEYIWVFDGCANGDLQDWLRESGEFVCGGSREGDELENERQLNQVWFESLGFNQPFSKNFTNIDEAMKHVQENSDKRWILKQNGDAPKHLNHMGKFAGNEDMLFHLKELKKGWNEQQYGKFNCDLMEVVEGVEIAASAFFNGHDWLRNKSGKVIGYLNFEEKKEIDDNQGETTGEMGTTFLGCTEDNKTFNQIMLLPGIPEYLKKIKFQGVFDINGTLRPDGTYTAFEPTMRWGVPASSYEAIEGLKIDTGKLIEAMAKGLDIPIEIHEGVGMVMVIAAKPYPVEVDLEDEATSLGEKIWIKDGDKLRKEFSDDQKKHIHLYNFEKTEDPETKEICYKVATKSGYLLTVTGRQGKTIEEVRKNLIQYIKDNIYISGMKFRSDIGKRVEKYFK